MCDLNTSGGGALVTLTLPVSDEKRGEEEEDKSRVVHGQVHVPESHHQLQRQVPEKINGVHETAVKLTFFQRS